MKNKIFTFNSFWLLVILLIYGNSLGQNSIFSNEKEISSAFENLSDDKVDSFLNLYAEKDSIGKAIKIAHKYSLILYRKGKYERGLKYVKFERSLYELNGIFNKNYIGVLYNEGLFYDKNLEFLNGLNSYKEIIAKDTFNYRIGNAYFLMARAYNRLGYYEKSVDYYLKRIKYLEGGQNYNSMVSAYLSMSIALNNINTLESLSKSLKILKQAEYLVKTNKITTSRLVNLNTALGNFYINKNSYDFEKVKYYRLKNLLLGFRYNDSSIIANAYNNLAYLYNLDKRDSAKYYVNEGLKYARHLVEVKARLYDNLCDYQILQEDYFKSLKSIHKSLEIMTKSKINGIPNDYQMSKSILRDYTLFCLKKKAEVYNKISSKSKNTLFLSKAISCIDASEYLISDLLNGTTEQSTQMIWRREASQAYLYGAYAAHQIGDPEKAFSFMEKNKALLLSESVLKNTEFANLPRHISQQETTFQKQIYELENQLSKDEENSILQDSLFYAKLTHEKYVDSLKTVYPKYFARKIDVNQVTLKEVQEELGSKDAILSYISNDFDRDTELIIGLVATKDQAKTFEIKNTQELRQKLQTYRELISEPFTTKEEQDSFKKVAFELNTILLPTTEIRSLVHGKNLMIIPDGDLQNIPFESLITRQNSHEYLILNGDISYSYSYSFLKHNEKVNRITTQDFVGYSPSSFETLSLNNLSNTKEEIVSINKELGGIAKLHHTATKQDFLSNSSGAKIIHLATHADVGKNPWVAFSDEKLELHELYTYKNNADLVTLSACNTSLGELAKGEGVLSLARGFFHSGSKSVVSSLWEVNDKSTSEIMTNFYKNLKNGQTKSEAINNAKRSYISNHTLSEQSPYYWSSFILIGDAGTIDLNSNLYLYLIAGLLVVIIILFFRKKIKISG